MSIVGADKRSRFADLFEEFLETYPATPDGQRHIQMYDQIREQGRRNYEEIVAAAGRGEEITDPVLLKMLPYGDSASNREKGAWVHLAPAVTGDIKKWFEASGWTDPEDWPHIAQAILDFVRRCDEHPATCQQLVRHLTVCLTPPAFKRVCSHPFSMRSARMISS